MIDHMLFLIARNILKPTVSAINNKYTVQLIYGCHVNVTYI